mgnify:FL=1
MKVRYAKKSDIKIGVTLGAVMWAESSFISSDFSKEKLYKWADALIDDENGFVAVAVDDNDILFGMYLGCIEQHFFGNDIYARDYLWFVEPTKRGGMAAVKLVKKFEEWAKERGATELRPGISTGIYMDKTKGLYERLGYEHVGYLFKKQIEKEA